MGRSIVDRKGIRCGRGYAGARGGARVSGLGMNGMEAIGNR